MSKLAVGELREVDLSNWELSVASLTFVKGELMQNWRLRVLDLGYNLLGNGTMKVIGELLGQGRLEELSLRWNRITA